MAKRILLAEDEAMLAVTFADILEDAGYQVSLAFDGREALERASAARMVQPFDALVTDLKMPRMGGEDLIRAMRESDPSLPVVVVTGSPPPGGVAEFRRRCAGQGPLALLVKPVGDKQLLDAVTRVVALGLAGAVS
jgi:CheY-like chemotaxis protein